MQNLLFDVTDKEKHMKDTTGTFINNMKLPIHRWFKYSAGFSAQWVESFLSEQVKDVSCAVVLDPFAGSGTTLVATDKLGIQSIGIEPHPFIFKIASTKLLWNTDIKSFIIKAQEVLKLTNKISFVTKSYPKLINNCYDEKTLIALDKLKHAWIQSNDDSNESKLVWLAITSILRKTSFAGTAQWQYILPNKRKKRVHEPYIAFESQIEIMSNDMQFLQRNLHTSRADLLLSDARSCPEIANNTIDLVITSPPYANNYDYADATRFEMTFWGEIESWGDLHDAVRKYLIRSSSQHVSKDKLELDELLSEKAILPIYDDISKACKILAVKRLSYGGKKHYHTMIAAYFIDMAKVWQELRRVCKEGATLCYVIGDSAPYSVYIPVEKWLGELAIANGFKTFEFEKIRDRNIKWKNRKHRVPLQEGRLWLKG